MAESARWSWNFNWRKEKKKIKHPLLKIHFTITPDNYKTMRDYYEFYINKFPDIDEIKFHAPRFADKKMGIDYFEIMEKNFKLTVCHILVIFLMRICKGMSKNKYKKIAWGYNLASHSTKGMLFGSYRFKRTGNVFKVPSYYQERKCVCFNSMAIQPNRILLIVELSRFKIWKY